MFSHLFGKETVVGIDIGSSLIKAVEIEPAGNGWRLVGAALQPTPPESVKDGVIADIAEVSSAVRTLLRTANIKASGAICAITGPQVIVRQVQFPKMTEAALRKSIRFEATKHISASVDDSVVEFEILGDAEDPNLMNVMLVAAPKDMVDGRVRVMEAAGLDPLAIDLEAFCLMRSLVEAGIDTGNASRTVAVVDMGACHTDVNILSNGEFALTRSIPVAGNSFTNAIKSLNGSTFEEAEQLKHEMNLQEPQGVEVVPGQEADNKCWRAVQPLVDELLREIRRSIHYYQSQFPEGAEQGQISKMILVGGTARMQGMASYVSGKLNMPVETGDVFTQAQISCGPFDPGFIDEHSPVLAVAVGLALKDHVKSRQPVAA